ncbi:hypothetical protein [Altererythrobacter sp. ZODW24]|uniref:hypothetical protein n=1 Tax=Altererythrobacter sp. ZODW24 TaxID=2185142 RepID=UPI000DF8481F|nr:hypothetical protein [Altererythrobacter sp. ZODW24]
MTNLNKALVGTVAAGAMAFSAAPAVARDNDRIDAGEVIAGALIIGGIAAVLSSSSKKNDGRYYDRRGYRDRDYRSRDDRRSRNYRRGGKRAAIQKCVNRAERRAIRLGARRADVTDIRDVERTRNGWKVKGRIAVQSRNYRGNRNRGQGWDNDYRGYNRNRHSGYDSGKFTCRVNYNGRVNSVDFKGLRI